MAGNFIAMVYAVLRDKGVDTKGMSTDEAVKKYEELTGKTERYSVQTGSKESGATKQRLSKREYAIVSHARAEKVAKQRKAGKMPHRDYVFTDEFFVVYKNSGVDNFTITKKILIENNQHIISRYIEELENEND